MVSSFPEWVEPMAATLTQERFTALAWIFERKLDGIRLLAFKNGSEIRLLSRNRLPQKLPAFAEAMAGLPVREVILDGEVTWGARGVTYHVFDIMWLDGRDVTSLTLDERRALVERTAAAIADPRVPPLDDPEAGARVPRRWEGGREAARFDG